MSARMVSDMKQKLVYGVGISDKGKHPASINRKPTKVYDTWRDMLRRCYVPKVQQKQPTYIGCTVCDEWLSFQEFAEWYYANYPEDGNKYQLDKDLKVIGNKVYSPETCLFVSSQVNAFTTDCGAKRGQYLIGACWDRRNEKFKARCSNPLTGKNEFLGLFPIELQAHLAWRKRKSQLAYELAMTQVNPDVRDALLRWRDALDANLIHQY